MRYLFLLSLMMASASLWGQGKESLARDFQQKLNEEFADENGPLKEKERKKFKGLPFYEIDTAFAVEARLEPTPEDSVFQMKTTTERMPEYRRYGILHFELQGQKFQLNVYQNIKLSEKPGYEDYLFLPFKDLTSGNDTYGGGRYINLRIPAEGNMLTIDFNQCYNPYCAYNSKYSCPIVPPENFLEIEVLAGVKAP